MQAKAYPITVWCGRVHEDSFESWRLAVEKFPGESQNVHQIIKRLGAWMGSTSGVERLFSKLSRRQPFDVSETVLREDAVLCCMPDFHTRNRSCETDAKLLHNARQAWASIGEDRGTYAMRRDKGTKRKATDELPCEAEWRKRRAAEVMAQMTDPNLGNSH